MRKIALILLALLSAVPAFGQGGIANFPQTVPPNTVVGRLGITPGPTSAIPISQLAAVFGASQSFTVNARCDGATNDTAAINADLAKGGYWTIPPGRTCNVTQINITQSGTRISGAGFNSSVIQGTTANAPTINISATLSNVYLDGFQVTKSVTATSTGTGIKFNGDCQYCVIDGLYAQKNWVGFALQSTGIGHMRHVLSQYNLSDGIAFTNSAISGTLQWDLDDVFSGQNSGRGYYVAPSVAGPTGITLGSWHNVRTFANTGPGIAIACSVSIPCNGFRLTKGLIGQDNNHEIFLDTYGGLHTILDTYVELAGTSPTGPTFATPPNNTGDGVRITANNLDVSIGSLYANGNHDSGINTSATVSTNVSGVRISNHGLYGIISADCAKLTVTSINFVSNTTANIQCTTNNGSQQVVTSTPAALNTPAAASLTAGVATNGATVATSTNASFFPLFAASSSNSNQPFNLDTTFTYNPSTDALTLGGNLGVGGAVTGTQTGAQITSSLQPMLVVRASGGAATKQMARFTYDPASSLTNPGFLFQTLTDAGAFSSNDDIFWGAGGGISIGSLTYPGVGGLQINGQTFAPNITTTSAAQTGTVCWTTGTGKFTVDTTVGCLTSIMAAKNITERLGPAKALDIVTRLDPFAFRYKSGYGDGGHYEQFGLGAEEVALIDERLVGRDPEGTLQGVRYQEMAAVLAGAIKQLKADNDNLRVEVRALQARRKSSR